MKFAFIKKVAASTSLVILMLMLLSPTINAGFLTEEQRRAVDERVRTLEAEEEQCRELDDGAEREDCMDRVERDFYGIEEDAPEDYEPGSSNESGSNLNNPANQTQAEEESNTVNLGEINDSSSFSVSDILKTTGQNQKYLNDPSGNAPLVAAILDVIEFIIRIVGAIAILLIILGGLYMIISEGSEDKLEKGKTILTSAIIGLVIAMFSYLIVRFVQSIFY